MEYIRLHRAADVTVGASLKLDADAANASMKTFKAQVREAEQSLLSITEKFGATSNEAMKAAKRVAELKDRIGDAKNLADAFNPDQKFRALSQSLNGVLGGFTAITGAMGLLGVESEQVQKQLLKVQSALALSQGLNQIGDSIQSFKNLAAIVKEKVVAAFSTLRGAIISTGIGALVVALGVLVANFDKIKEALFGVDRAAKSAADASEKGAKAEQEKLDAIDGQENILRLQGKTEAEILKMKISQTDEVIQQREQQLLASVELQESQQKAAERNHKILRGIIDFITKPIRFVLETAAKVSDFLGFTDGALDRIKKGTEEVNKSLTNFVFDPEEIKKDGEEAQKELKNQINALRNQRAGYILSLRGKAGKEEDPEIKRVLGVDIKPEEDPVVLAEVKKAEIILSTRQALTNKIIDLSNVEAAVQQGNIKQTAYTEQQMADARIAAMSAVGSALGYLGQLVGQQTAAGKVLGIAQATINTWIGVTEVLRNKTVLPEPMGTIQKVASVATIIASGLVAVRNIVKTKVPGASGGGPSFGSVSAPVQSSPQFTNTRLDRNQLNQIGNATVKAFVVESDVTNNQERIRRLNRAARI